MYVCVCVYKHIFTRAISSKYTPHQTPDTMCVCVCIHTFTRERPRASTHSPRASTHLIRHQPPLLGAQASHSRVLRCTHLERPHQRNQKLTTVYHLHSPLSNAPPAPPPVPHAPHSEIVPTPAPCLKESLPLHTDMTRTHTQAYHAHAHAHAHIVRQCRTLQHTAEHCSTSSTLQHTATHCTQAYHAHTHAHAHTVRVKSMCDLTDLQV